MDRRSLRTWIDLDRNALAHNVLVFRGLLPRDCRLMAVCKSNAYGHGLYDLTPVLQGMEVDSFGVDSIVEAVTLRKKGIRRPILVLGYTLPSRFAEAAEYGVSLTVSNLDNLRALAAARGLSRLNIHLKLDTGMHRQGFLPSQWEETLGLVQKWGRRVQVEGVYTHFAAAKDPGRREYTEGQIEEFERAVACFRDAGLNPMRHANATAGVLNYPRADYELARVGIGLMGYWPSSETRQAWDKKIVLKPASATWSPSSAGTAGMKSPSMKSPAERAFPTTNSSPGSTRRSRNSPTAEAVELKSHQGRPAIESAY